MQAWTEDQHADNIEFIPDGNGDFAREMGMLGNKSDIGFDDPFEVSDADTILHHIKPDVTLPARVSLFTKPAMLRLCFASKAP